MFFWFLTLAQINRSWSLWFLINPCPQKGAEHEGMRLPQLANEAALLKGTDPTGTATFSKTHRTNPKNISSVRRRKL
jgi:hypothetical protein